MKKFLIFVVIVLLIAGGAWLAIERPWETGGETDQAEAPAETPAPAPEPEPTAEPEPAAPAGPTALPGLDAELQLAAGWQIQPGAPEAETIPGGEAVVLRKGDSKLPLLLIGRLGAEMLGEADPAAYPATFVAALQNRLAKLQPAPTVSRAGVLQQLPPLLTSAQELIASGAFPSFGVDQGSGRFVAGTSADNRVYLIISLVQADSEDERISDDMIGTLAPTGGAPAEEPATEPAEPAAEPAAEAPAEPATEPAPAAEPAPAGESLAPNAAPAEAPTPAAEPKGAPAPPANPAAQPKEAPAAQPKGGPAPAAQPKAGPAPTHPAQPKAAPATP